jgi:hypothetical protein
MSNVGIASAYRRHLLTWVVGPAILARCGSVSEWPKETGCKPVG